MYFFGFLFVGLIFFLRECLEDAVELVAAGLKCGYNILGGRLEECDDVGDEFVLALDGSESVELVSSEVNGSFYISALESGQCVAFLDEVLQELGGSVAHVGAHQRGGTVKGAIEFGVVAFESLESLVEKSVLDHEELDVSVEACATESRSLFSVESGSLYQVETIVLLDGLGDLSDDYSFIFLFHCVRVLTGLSLN